jgi:hypothetical protein
VEPVIDGGYYRLILQDRVLIVELQNTDTMPSINYHALNEVFSAMQTLIAERDLITSGWCVLYDFSALTYYEMAAATAFANFFRWARVNGRQKSAHIFPRNRNDGQVAMIKRVILSLVTQISSGEDDHYSAIDRKDALRWFQEVLAKGEDHA